MRTGLVISIGLLIVVLVGGYLAEGEVSRTAARYISAAEELRVMTEEGAWARARETLTAYREQWEAEQGVLRAFVRHEAMQEMSMAMERLLLGIEQQDASQCALSCLELRQQAAMLKEQETLSWTNLL